MEVFIRLLPSRYLKYQSSSGIEFFLILIHSLHHSTAAVSLLHLLDRVEQFCDLHVCAG